MKRPAIRNSLKHLRASDVRGIAKLATQATLGVARITEGVHQSVWSSMGFPGSKEPGTTRGIASLVYRSVRGITQLLGAGANAALDRLEPLLGMAEGAAPETPQREAVLAALNGVLGDRLAASGSPLATRMTLRYQGRALEWQAMPPMPQPTGKLLVLIHGLCMNDLQWHTAPKLPHGGTQDANAPRVFDHGGELASELGYTPIYLRYNTGLHISQNGRELAAQLELLLAEWPTPILELAVLAHSMGGLVIRSAVECAREQSLRWPGHLKQLVFLGTPHHGAPLERAGNWVDALLGSTPWTRPFARLAQLRSAGITDLRYGYMLDEDWQDRERFRRRPDTRCPLPLPQGIACYAVAATLAAKRGLLADRLIGDGLVPLQSALGRHEDPQRSLAFGKNSQYIGYRMSHLQLLSSPDVGRQIRQWLAPDSERSRASAP
jgi:hypothetical protein